MKNADLTSTAYIDTPREANQVRRKISETTFQNFEILMKNAGLSHDGVYNNKQKRLILDEEGFLDDDAVYRYCESAKMTNTERV